MTILEKRKKISYCLLKSNQEAPLEQQRLENLLFHKGNEYTAVIVKINFSELWKEIKKKKRLAPIYRAFTPKNSWISVRTKRFVASLSPQLHGRLEPSAL